MSESKDEDLLKIQIISERCHVLLTSKFSLIFGGLIGFMVLFYTLYYSGTFSPLVFWVSLSSWAVACIFFIWRIVRAYNLSMKRLSDMIEKVRQGEKLPSLKQLVDAKEANKDETKQELSNGSKLNVKNLLLLIQGILIAFILQLFYDTLREVPFYQNIAPTEVWRSVLAIICGIFVLLIFRYFKKHS